MSLKSSPNLIATPFSDLHFPCWWFEGHLVVLRSSCWIRKVPEQNHKAKCDNCYINNSVWVKQLLLNSYFEYIADGDLLKSRLPRWTSWNLFLFKSTENTSFTFKKNCIYFTYFTSHYLNETVMREHTPFICIRCVELRCSWKTVRRK